MTYTLNLINRVSDLLKRSDSYREYGPGYRRNIHAAAAHVESAMNRGHSVKMIDHLADILELRLNLEEKKS